MKIVEQCNESGAQFIKDGDLYFWVFPSGRKIPCNHGDLKDFRAQYETNKGLVAETQNVCAPDGFNIAENWVGKHVFPHKQGMERAKAVKFVTRYLSAGDVMRFVKGETDKMTPHAPIGTKNSTIQKWARAKTFQSIFTAKDKFNA